GRAGIVGPLKIDFASADQSHCCIGRFRRRQRNGGRGCVGIGGIAGGVKGSQAIIKGAGGARPVAMSGKLLGEGGKVWVIRFWVKPLSVARSRWNPVWLVALLVQVKATEVAEAG